MSDYNLSNVEMRRIFRMLREISDMAQHASVTGFLKQGRQTAMNRYNAILSHLEQSGLVPGGLFRPLSPDASFDELNIESRLLASYIEDDVKRLQREQRGEQRANRNAFADPRDIEEVLEEVRELKELKEAVEESLPGLLERGAGAKEEVLAELQELRDLRASISEMLPEVVGQRAARPEPPVPPTPPAPPNREELERQIADLQRRLAETEAGPAER